MKLHKDYKIGLTVIASGFFLIIIALTITYITKDHTFGIIAAILGIIGSIAFFIGMLIIRLRVWF